MGGEIVEAMRNFLNINTTFFTVLGYPMSYLEFFGTLLNLWSVWLVARNNILTWPIGIVAVILFGILFYQIQLYSDFMEQVYFIGSGFYGWWAWIYLRRKKKGKKSEGAKLRVSRTSTKNIVICGAIIAAGTISMGYLMGHIHEYLPSLFTEPASYPYLDAFTTVMSFVAMILMAHKKVECWYLWIAVDVIGIWLYFVKDVRFIAFLYCIFLAIATKGLFNWRNVMKKQEQVGE